MSSELLKGKRVILTGGNGKLGSVFIKMLRDHRAEIAILDKVLQNKQKRIKDEKVHYYSCDVTDKQSIERAVEQISKDMGSPNVLVNAAAIDSPPSSESAANFPFEKVPGETFREIMDVNVMGVVYCCQVVGDCMKKNGGGVIINIGSIYGMLSPNHTIYSYKNTKEHPWYKPAAYSVSKSALLNLTRYLATYWAKENIRVNVLSPAGVKGGQDQEFIEVYTKNVPMGRMAEAEEIAGALVFLASDLSSYMTGHNLVVDGGLSAW